MAQEIKDTFEPAGKWTRAETWKNPQVWMYVAIAIIVVIGLIIVLTTNKRPKTEAEIKAEILESLRAPSDAPEITAEEASKGRAENRFSMALGCSSVLPDKP